MAKEGVKWTSEFEKELFTAAEIEENNLQARLLCELIDARQKKASASVSLKLLAGLAKLQSLELKAGLRKTQRWKHCLGC